jgi:Cu2+-exporting ATPase/Cu+-exporting ATPase
MEAARTFKIEGMHCASCAATIERVFRKREGVQSAVVNYATETAKVTFDEHKVQPQDLSKAIAPLGYTLVLASATASAAGAAPPPEHDHHVHEIAELRTRARVGVALALVDFAVMGWAGLATLGAAPAPGPLAEGLTHLLLLLVASYMLFAVGWPYCKGVLRFLRHGVADMDTLVGLGTGTAYFYSLALDVLAAAHGHLFHSHANYYDVTIVVIAFVTFGKYLEARAKLKTGDAIEKLLNLQAKTALVRRDGQEIETPVERVVPGDLIVVKPGTKIAVDGEVVEGESFVEEALVTGEPMPAEKKPGAKVFAGTMNTQGALVFRATKVGADTLLANIVKMVAEAQGSKAAIQSLADKVAAVFVPVVLGLAVLALALWLTVGGHELGLARALPLGLVSFVGILVIACPCALGLATPTAIIVGVGKGASEGILIKDAATLETLNRVNVAVVDKTGTLTTGRPEVEEVEIRSPRGEDEVIAILAALERKSEHPLARAVLAYAERKKIAAREATAFENRQGRGVRATVDGQVFYAGNERLARELGLAPAAETVAAGTVPGRTPVLLMTEKEILAVVYVADAIRDNAREAVAKLHELGIRVVLCTGDNRAAAEQVARAVGVDEVVAEALPEDKLKKIKELQAQGKIVAMAGDGINDAPALAQADVGVAMSTGADVAIASAGVVLLHGDIVKLAKAVRLARLTLRGIKQNLFWASIYNLIGIPLAGGLFYPWLGWTLSPAIAGVAMAFSSVSVVTNSLRLKMKRL